MTHAEAAEVREDKAAERFIGGEKKGETFNQHPIGCDLAACTSPPLTAFTL